MKIKTPELKVETPEPQRAPPAPGPKADAPPGLDAQGEGAGDAFGLEGRPGGGDFGGEGGGGGGSRFGWYHGQIRDRILEAMQRRSKQLKQRAAGARLRVWIGSDGGLQRVELLSSSGDAALDALLLELSRSIRRLDPPPADMPQPVNLQLGARAGNGGF